LTLTLRSRKTTLGYGFKLPECRRLFGSEVAGSNVSCGCLLIMAGPLISIVTPSYNQGAFIAQTIESVLGQSYSNFEYWVIDGGSTDETISLLKKYEKDPRLQWVSEKDRGQSHAINKGIERCRGHLFNWINSDDYFEHGVFQKLAEAWNRDPKQNLFTGTCRKFENGTEKTNGYLRLEIEKNAEETLAIGRFCQPSTFWRMAILKSWGGARQDLHCAMDFHLWARYLVEFGLGGIYQTEDVFAHYREHSGSKSAKLNAQFKDEIFGIYLHLLRELNAPSLLLNYLRELTKQQLNLSWKIGTEFRKDRFTAIMASQSARKLYYQKAYARSRELVKLANELCLTFEAARLKIKLMFKP
jgi:glycosyltransferase involved in cell wall biosynthesis